MIMNNEWFKGGVETAKNKAESVFKNKNVNNNKTAASICK